MKLINCLVSDWSNFIRFTALLYIVTSIRYGHLTPDLVIITYNRSLPICEGSVGLYTSMAEHCVSDITI